MENIENLIDQYIKLYGNQKELELHKIYQGNYSKVFLKNSTSLEEAVQFEAGETIVFSVIYFILDTIAKKIIKDGFEFTKKQIMLYLKKDKKKIVIKSDKKNIELTEEVIEKLISMLEAQENNKKL